MPVPVHLRVPLDVFDVRALVPSASAVPAAARRDQSSLPPSALCMVSACGCSLTKILFKYDQIHYLKDSPKINENIKVLLDLPGNLSGVGIASSSLIEYSSARSASNQPMLLLL